MSSTPELPPRTGEYRIGIFGSMCDPPHIGHLSVVRTVINALALDRMIVVPSGDHPPHRQASSIHARSRLQLAVDAWAGDARVVVSDCEVERSAHGEPGWMIDTIDDLLSLPGELGMHDVTIRAWLVLGADQLAAFDEWYQWQQIARRVRLAVVTRPEHIDDAHLRALMTHLEQCGVRIDLVPCSIVDASSTAIRSAARRGDVDTVSELVPASILREVLSLYQAS